MVRSIDPRRETLRGIQWPFKVAALFGTHVAKTILAAAQAVRPDIWTQAIRSSPESHCKQGAVHIWIPAFAGMTAFV